MATSVSILVSSIDIDGCNDNSIFTINPSNYLLCQVLLTVSTMSTTVIYNIVL